MKTVLVLEDESTIRDFVVINLKRSGYKTTEAATGEEALKLIEVNPYGYSLFILDVNLWLTNARITPRRLRSLGCLIFDRTELIR